MIHSNLCLADGGGGQSECRAAKDSYGLRSRGSLRSESPDKNTLNVTLNQAAGFSRISCKSHILTAARPGESRDSRREPAAPPLSAERGEADSDVASNCQMKRQRQKSAKEGDLSQCKLM